jgi:hypothetical protein
VTTTDMIDVLNNAGCNEQKYYKSTKKDLDAVDNSDKAKN